MQSIAPWLIWMALLIALSIIARKDPAPVTNPRSLAGVPALTETHPAATTDCNGNALANAVSHEKK